MEIQALGYLALGSPKLDDWRALATRCIGMQEVDRGGSLAAFRMDDRKQRFIVDGALAAEGPVFGWEVADAVALDALAARLENAGVAVRREPAALADARCVAGLIAFADPAGNRLEAFHGAAVADEPFRPARDIGGFRTGPQGIGHVLLATPDLGRVLAFYRDLLGFRISDFIRGPVTAYFLHVNPRHHSLALVEAPQRAMHHLMVEFFAFDDLGQGYDIALGMPERIAATLGRHSNDLMTSFYMRTPSPMLIECGWGGREVDTANWTPQELATVGSFWGHRGLFESLDDDHAPPPVPPPAERRAPLQVIDGNYHRMKGVCPWWDALSGKAGAGPLSY